MNDDARREWLTEQPKHNMNVMAVMVMIKRFNMTTLGVVKEVGLLLDVQLFQH